MTSLARISLALAIVGGVVDSATPRLSVSEHRTRAPVIEQISHRAIAFQTYQLVELHVALGATYQNPFDPAQIDLYAIFHSPSGRPYRVNGFYYQRYALIKGASGALPVRPVGVPEWRIRFACPYPGNWAYRVYVRDATRHTTSSSTGSPIRVVQGSSPGYVRISRYDPRYFAFDNGTPYFPVGENLAFWYHGISDYQEWLARPGSLRGTGINLIRVWMAPGKDNVDYTYPLGNYRAGLPYAWALDRILTWAKRDNIHVILTLALHATLQNRTDWLWDWSKSPYNRARGGPASSPCAFFTNPSAIEMFERNLRYVIARWGYSTSIFAWELFNEVDLIEGYKSCRDGVLRWHRIMIDALRQLDPASHLITTTFAHMPGDPRIWSLGGVDIVQIDHYSPNIPGYVTRDLRLLRGYRKPEFAGEYGPWTVLPPTIRDEHGWYIHLAQWASLLGGAAGSGLNWFWEDYVQRFRTYWVYRALPRFLAGIPLDRQAFTPVPPTAHAVSDGSRARVYVLRGRTISFLWILRLGRYRSAARLSLAARGPAPVRIQWWNTVSGTPIRSVEVRPRHGKLIVRLPGSARDYAAKMWG